MKGEVPSAAGGVNPPYVSFQAFDAFIAEVAIKGLPEYCDASVFESFSAATRAQLLTALRFLALLTTDGLATAPLRELAHAHGTARYGKVLGEVLDRAYRLPNLDLLTATPSQFSDMFESLGCSRSILRKAQVFYLKACNAAGRRIGPRLEYGRRPLASAPVAPRRARRTLMRGDVAESLAHRPDAPRPRGARLPC